MDNIFVYVKNMVVYITDQIIQIIFFYIYLPAASDVEFFECSDVIY